MFAAHGLLAVKLLNWNFASTGRASRPSPASPGGNSTFGSTPAPSSRHRLLISSAISRAISGERSWSFGMGWRPTEAVVCATSWPSRRGASIWRGCRPMPLNSIPQNTYGATGNATRCPTSAPKTLGTSPVMPGRPCAECKNALPLSGLSGNKLSFLCDLFMPILCKAQ